MLAPPLLLIQPPQFVLDSQGNKIGVFIDIETYERLFRDLEDHYDNKLIDETLDEETVPWEEVKADLRRAGKL